MHANVFKGCSLIVLLAALAGCGGREGGNTEAGSTAVLDGNTVTDEAHGFEITFPKSWSVTKAPPGGLAMRAQSKVAAGAKEPAVILVLIADMPDNATIQEHVIRTTKPDMIKTTFKNGEVGEKLDLKIGGVDAARVTLLFDRDDSGQTKNVSYMIVKGKRLYSISTTLPKNDFDFYAKEIDATAKSVRFLAK